MSLLGACKPENSYLLINAISHAGTDNSGGDKAQTQANVCEATDSDAEVIDPREQVWGNISCQAPRHVSRGLPGKVVNIR